jgi:hypothetical protein
MNSSDMRQRCELLVDTIMSKPGATVFNDPVDRQQWPEWYEIVDRPMDLTSVKQAMSQYTTVEDFAADMRVTFHNYIEHNEATTEIAKLAQRFGALLQRLLRTWLGNPTPPMEYLDDDICHVCHTDMDEDVNSLLECEGCDVLCHQNCLPSGVTHSEQDQQWHCRHCAAGQITRELFTPPPTHAREIPVVPQRDGSTGNARSYMGPEIVTEAGAGGTANAQVDISLPSASTPTRAKIGDMDLDELNWADSPTHIHTRHSWRDPPEHSFSDWNLIAVSVRSEGSGTDGAGPGILPQILQANAELMTIRKSGEAWSFNRRAYCVHKIYIAHGHRASLFLRDAMIQPGNSGTRSTTLEVPTFCVGCMEMLLDYLYEDHLSLTATSMLPMLLLARVLRINALGAACTAFLREHLSNCRQAPFIYALAVELELQKVEQASAAVVAQNFGLYAPTTFDSFKISAFLDVLSHAELEATDGELCAAATAFVCNLKQNSKLTRSDFDAIVEKLPAVTASDSVFLLSTAYELGSMAFAFVCFQESVLEDKIGLPVNMFVNMLQSDRLLVKDEDTVLGLIRAYIKNNMQSLEDQDKVELWQTCRFAWLSWQAQANLLDTGAIPAGLFFEDAVASSIMHRSSPDDFQKHCLTRNKTVQLRLKRRIAYEL